MRLIPLLTALTLALPAAAEQHAEPEGRDLMSEAMRLFMRGLMEEMEPALEDLSDLIGQIDSYHPPEMLPNGDIIIRKKTQLEMEQENGEVEL